MRRLMLVTLLGVLVTGALSGCSKNPASTTLGTMNVLMTDSPGDFQAVNLAVTEVAVQHSTGNGGWEVLQSKPHTYDLLQLRNGVFATLGLSPLPAGHYNQLRLMLGAGSTVVVDNVAHPLNVPSSMSSGLKLAGSFDVPVNGRIDLALDFDVARSILPNADGSYSLKPVIRVVTISLPDSKPGAIQGLVAPSGVQTSVFALLSADTVASSMTAADGSFTIPLLPAGTYRLAFHPRQGYQDCAVDGVVVKTGETANAGTVTLTPVPPPPPPPPTKGTIAGTVSPAGVQATVSAMQGGTVVGQAAVDAGGAFSIPDLLAGSYDLQVQPSPDYQVASLAGVSVVAGATTTVGPIVLSPVPPPPPPPPPPPGSIMGQLVPAGVPVMLTVMQGSTLVAQTEANMDGTFLIGSLPAGTYSLLIHPLFDFADSTVPGVVVTSGNTTNLGIINL